MNVKDFIKNTLQQIGEGILEANEALEKTDAIINPSSVTVHSGNSQAYGRTSLSGNEKPSSDSRIVEKVDFDIAVSVQEGSSSGAGIKVSVMSIGLGAGGKSEERSGMESRIKFSIPMVFQQQQEPNKWFNSLATLTRTG